MFYEPGKTPHNLPHDPFKACVAPRPIGWITTINADGAVNLAPYSFFNGMYSWPNILGFSSEKKKDSLHFARETGEFTWNMATWDLRENMNLSSEGLKMGHSEFKYSGLTPEQGRMVSAPRVAESPASLECKVTQILELTDQLFQWCRKSCGTYQMLWEDLNALFKLILFNSWEEMLIRCLFENGDDPPQLV